LREAKRNEKRRGTKSGETGKAKKAFDDIKHVTYELKTSAAPN
jgi:hypothetical protein